MEHIKSCKDQMHLTAAMLVGHTEEALAMNTYTFLIHFDDNTTLHTQEHAHFEAQARAAIRSNYDNYNHDARRQVAWVETLMDIS